MTRAIVLAMITLLSTNAVAADPAAPAQPAAAAAPAPTDPGVCADDATKAAQQQKREAALAELGRRLAAEPPVEADFRVLNRSGHNYGARSVQSLAPPARPDTESQ